MTKRKKPTRKPASKPVAKPRPRDARSQSETFADDAEATDSLSITSSIDDHPCRPDKTERKDKVSAEPTTPRANTSNGDEQEADESTIPTSAATNLPPEKTASEPQYPRASEENTDRERRSRGTAQPTTSNATSCYPDSAEDEDGNTRAANVECDAPATTKLRLRPLRRSRGQAPDMALDGKIIVAVDFGTTFSGWPDNDCLGAVSNAKVPTELQYTEDGFVWGFGIPHDMLRHQWFKLGLDPKRPKPMSGLASALPDEKAAPPEHNQSPETLVKDYLSALRQHLESVLAKTLPGSVFMTTPREYIITVPAIWSDAAVSKTRKCAERAGMGRGEELRLVSEPEAAAIWALPRIVPFKPRIGDTFVLCDAGGGTVDLISYQIQALNPILRVIEVARGDGGLCGSTFLNRSFRAFLRGKLRGHPAWHDDMLDEAEKRFDAIVKRGFNGSKTKNYQIPVPAFPNDESLNVYKAMFSLKGEDLCAMFEPVIQEVIILVTSQLHAAKAVHAAARAVVLVGGFGENNYLYQRITEAVADSKVEVLRPAGGWTAVVHGALMKGLSEASKNTTVTSISGRKARYYFGTASAKAFEKMIHPTNARFWSKANKRHEINTYDWFILKNATVKEEKPKNLPYHFELPVSAVEGGALVPITTTIVKYVDPEDTGPPIVVGDSHGLIRPVQQRLTGC
ncbi:MAG: hypothetical protein Q9185_002725 [Variospora sp. 1 TL-2023]